MMARPNDGRPMADPSRSTFIAATASALRGGSTTVFSLGIESLGRQRQFERDGLAFPALASHVVDLWFAVHSAVVLVCGVLVFGFRFWRGVIVPFRAPSPSPFRLTIRHRSAAAAACWMTHDEMERAALPASALPVCCASSLLLASVPPPPVWVYYGWMSGSVGAIDWGCATGLPQVCHGSAIIRSQSRSNATALSSPRLRLLCVGDPRLFSPLG